MDGKRYEHLITVVLGTKEARELFEYERDLILSEHHIPTQTDPFNEKSKVALAVAETYQRLINFNKQLNGELENGIRSSGQPSIIDSEY